MNKVILFFLIFLFLSSCETDVNQPVHPITYMESFSCNWIVILDHWGEPVEYKCWSLIPIYLEEFDVYPHIAKLIIVTKYEDSSEVLIENPEGLEVIYDISDSTKVVYEKLYPKFEYK